MVGPVESVRWLKGQGSLFQSSLTLHWSVFLASLISGFERIFAIKDSCRARIFNTHLLKGSSLATYRTRLSKHLLIVGSFGVYYHLLSYLLCFFAVSSLFFCVISIFS